MTTSHKDKDPFETKRHGFKFDLSKEWCMKMAKLEGDSEVGAGLLALDPITEGEQISAWAASLCSLLDRIEIVADDADAVRDLCSGRFDIARKHGLGVTFEGITSGEDH